MALMLLAFAIPLAILIRTIAADRAIASANDDVRVVSTLVAANPDPANWREALKGSMTVFLPGHRPIGPAKRTPAVRLAARDDSSITVNDQGGTEIVVAVIFAGQGPPGNRTAVVRAFVPQSELTKGVTKSWLILAGLGLLLLAVGILIANLLVGTVTKPISELARVSHRLAAGGLEARASPDGPPEVRELAHGLNHLAGRIRELIRQERESVADLSHRLRTPLTALRLELEGMGSSADPDGRLSTQVQALDGAVTSLIEDARTRGTTVHGSCDAAELTRQRAEFWSVLAEDQGRTMRLDLARGPLMVGVADPELGACLDALLGNVFAYTPQRTGFTIALHPRQRGGAVLTVYDEGPGFAQSDPVRRGASGGGSTGLGLDIARQTAEASGGTLTVGPGPGGHVSVELGPPSDGGSDPVKP
jgi:signal transduction histidine kinase